MQIREEFTPDKKSLYGYELKRILGRGGSGCVYCAIAPNSNIPIALKLFYQNFFNSRIHLMDFSMSCNKFKKFVHQNVAQIYDFKDGEEGTCLMLEYIDGPDLKWYLENRPWNLQERLVIVAQICNGLQYLHDCGYLHHDLKPSNILFTRKGVAKLVDYSLCGSNFLLSLLDNGVHDQVTPLYVAPEIICREKATPRSDIYSLGVTMYLMFTGKTPFQVDSLQALYQCHLRVVPAHPTEVNPRCSRQLGNIIMKMMEKKPENRFTDCDQLRIAMQDIGKSRI